MYTKIDELEDFFNYFNNLKRVDLLKEGDAEAENNIQNFRVSNDFTATLESITDMKIDLDIFTKLKTTGRQFANMVIDKTTINTIDFSIAVDQLADGGRDFTVEVKVSKF